ncbi:FAD-dependent oxidoreductase [Micromonospora tarensis]|uniref:FAD-dependent oxidoreductase n=1 Tax=Micromonospora tarensis TaxID=2806100 RepID=UPI002814FC1D|nr:FAD-dependent oxidoreductase [Micromonospora tarensis]
MGNAGGPDAGDWAAQRIKNLSLATAIRNALLPRRRRTDVTSLIEEFQYPKYGPGMMWERCAEQVRERGGQVFTGSWVTAVHRDPTRRRAISVTVNGVGGQRTEVADHVISSMPISELVAALHPPAPPDVLACAADLRYRDFLTVALVVPAEFSFPDNWIYVHDPGVRVGRIQNFGSWSPYLVKDGRTCLGLEYFVFEDDEMWRTPDADLVALGTAELERLGLVRPGVVEAGYVVRMPKAYPVYDERYQHNVDTIRAWLAEAVPNVHPVGRNGMHRYNNQDHSMLTAMLTAENIATGSTHDVWSVNVEQDYHEQSSGGDNRGGTGRDAPVLPRRVITAPEGVGATGQGDRPAQLPLG